MTNLLAERTTFGVGGPAGSWLEPGTEAELIAAVSAADAQGEPVLILGGGSNLLISDDGFAGKVVHTGNLRGISVDETAVSSETVLRVAAGEPWDGFVADAVANGRAGIEALSGIPGFVGATPVQNVGAYGQEVSQRIACVRVWDRRESAIRTLSAGECRFGYRTSLFKQDLGRCVVLSVSYRLRSGGLSGPIRYSQLANTLGLPLGERAPLAEVREAVISLRRSKGMVYDRADHDTWSAGSFFTNPILADASQVPSGAPAYPQPDGRVKTSAAWLIEHAGFVKGYGPGLAQLSTKHTLALTNRGGAAAAEILDLAREIRDGVQQTYGITLVPEPVLVGLSLDS